MTEQTTIRPEHGEASPERERCSVGRSRAEHPCWREASVPRYDDLAQGPWVCTEHRRAFRLAERAEDYRDALEKLQTWIQEVPIGPEVQTVLMDSTYEQRTELERRYLEARIEADAADRLAAQSEGEALPLEEARKRAGELIREAALMNAYTTLQDLPATASRCAPCLWRFTRKGDTSDERRCSRRRNHPRVTLSA
jgi:hypothetical protein